jgi:hypothetical protein
MKESFLALFGVAKGATHYFRDLLSLIPFRNDDLQTQTG